MLIKQNCDIHDITVVTNQASYDYTSKNIKVEDYINNIIIIEKDKVSNRKPTYV